MAGIRLFQFFERLVDPYPPEQPEQPPKGLYSFCRHHIRGIERYLLLMAVFTTITSLGEVMLYAILGKLVDWLTGKQAASFLHNEWPILLLTGFFILVFMPIAAFVHSLIGFQTLMGNFPMRVRWLSHRYLLRQSYAFFQHEFSGRIATRLMQTALAVRESVMKLIDVMLFVIVYLVATVVLVGNADWRLCLPLLVWLIGYVGALRFFVPRLQGVSALQADARSLMTGRIVDSYTNILTLKLFSGDERESLYVKEGMTEFMDTVYPQMRLVTLLNGAVWSLNMCLVFTVATLGIYLWLNNTVTVGAITVALALAIRMTGMAHWIMWEVGNLFENIGIVQDGVNTLSAPYLVTDAMNCPELTVHRGCIEFDRVGFSYNGLTQVFDDLTLQVAAGEKVGIVGRSGAGKSTLVNLLLRFFDVQKGAITIDGQDISQVSQQSLRGNIAMVTQDTSLLHRSIRENILFGRPAATEAEMIQAARQAQADEFIRTLCDPKGRRGYDAHIGERGVTLSGGQRQRIALARVLLKDAPILVLDEATSALDSEVEAVIQQSLYKLMKGKTVIAIAHRLSTIAAMDRLIVFDKGRIVEQGTHAVLVNNGQLYAQLWARQSGGFLGFE